MKDIKTALEIRRVHYLLKKIWLCSVFLLVLIFSIPVHTQGSTVVVDASTHSGFVENIAGGINFWGQEEAQVRFIQEVGTHLYRIKVRLHEVVKQDDAYTNFRLEGVRPADMSGLIQNANLAKTMGCKIMLQIYGIPKWLSTSQDERVLTNNLPNYAKYPPTDYIEWARVVCAAVRALGNAGLAGVDYYEVFGEPNVGGTWYQQMMPCKQDGQIVYGCEPNELGHNTVQVIGNFRKVYDYTARGIKVADPGAKIGGVAIVPNPSGIWLTRLIARYFRLYNLPLDFYSWHGYAVDENLSSILSQIEPYRPLTIDIIRQIFESSLRNQGFSDAQIDTIIRDIYDYLKNLEELNQEAIRFPYSFVSSHLNRILIEEQSNATELFLTEWHVSSPRDRRHDTHYGASFITRALMDITDCGTDAQTLYGLSSVKPFYYDNGFGGFKCLFTLDGNNIPKASFNAFKLFSMLGDEVQRVFVDGSDDDIYGIATKDEDTISVLVTYYVMAEDPKNPDYGLSKSVVLTISNLPFSEYDYEVYLIDGSHSNSYYGSGPDLEIVDTGTGSGVFQEVIDLSSYSVLLIKVERIY